MRECRCTDPRLPGRAGRATVSRRGRATLAPMTASTATAAATGMSAFRRPGRQADPAATLGVVRRRVCGCTVQAGRLVGVADPVFQVTGQLTVYRDLQKAAGERGQGAGTGRGAVPRLDPDDGGDVTFAEVEVYFNASTSRWRCGSVAIAARTTRRSSPSMTAASADQTGGSAAPAAAGPGHGSGVPNGRRSPPPYAGTRTRRPDHDPVPRPVQTEERVLNHVLGGGLVADQHEREPYQVHGVEPEQVVDSCPGRGRQRIGLWPRASPVCEDRHSYRTPAARGMLIAATGQFRAAPRVARRRVS